MQDTTNDTTSSFRAEEKNVLRDVAIINHIMIGIIFIC